MTREEAYEIIEEVRNKICSRKYATEQSEAFDVALELLEQKPCEDCISRQAVLDKAFEIKTGKYTSAMVVYAHDIRTLSPVTPQSNTGH